MDQSASNNMRWAGCHGASSCGLLAGLLAKAVTAAGAQRAQPALDTAAGDSLLYAIQWQAHSSSCGAAAGREGGLPSYAAAEAPCLLFGGGSPSQGVTVHPNCTAESGLALVQQVRRCMRREVLGRRRLAAAPVGHRPAAGTLCRLPLHASRHTRASSC